MTENASDPGWLSTSDMISPGRSLRFEVVDGARRSASWTVFTGRHTDDIYVAARESAGLIKASFHASGRWRYGFTADVANEVLEGDADRVFYKWSRPPESAPGWTLAMQLVVPTSELRERPPGGAKVLEIPARNVVTTLEMWLEAPGHPQSLKLPKARGIGALNLIGGGRVWLIDRDFNLPWGDSASRFASEISEARKRALSVGLSGEISIVVHGEVSGTLLQVELTCSLNGTGTTQDS